MNNALRVAYFLHFPVGEKNGKFYIKDLLNDYFKNISISTETTIVGSCVDKEFYHNTLITEDANHNFLNSNDNRNIVKKIFQLFKIVKIYTNFFNFLENSEQP